MIQFKVANIAILSNNAKGSPNLVGRHRLIAVPESAVGADTLILPYNELIINALAELSSGPSKA